MGKRVVEEITFVEPGAGAYGRPRGRPRRDPPGEASSGSGSGSGTKGRVAGGMDVDEFRQTRSEIARLGAIGMGRRERREWDAKRLAELGLRAKREANHPRHIAIGIERSRAAQAEKRRLALVEQGVASNKGVGAERRRDRFDVKRAAERTDAKYYGSAPDVGMGRFKGGALLLDRRKHSPKAVMRQAQGEGGGLRGRSALAGILGGAQRPEKKAKGTGGARNKKRRG